MVSRPPFQQKEMGQTKKVKSASVLEKLPKSTVRLVITVPWSMVKNAYDQALTKKAAEVELTGFRKGKAPKNLVEQAVGKDVLYQQAFQTILPQAYTQAVKKHQLKPITTPKIKPLKVEENKDWQFEATTCEAPSVSLGDYQEKIKQELRTSKLWVPGQDEKPTEEPKENLNQKLNKVVETLLKAVKIELPPLLLENEVSRLLARLLEEIRRLGLTLESYLTSVGKTADQLRLEHQVEAEKSLKLEFILSKVADDLKVGVSDKEIEDWIEKGAKTKAEKEKLREQKYYLASILRRQKTIDKLLNL